MLSLFEAISDSTYNDLRLCFDQTEGMVSFDEALLLYRLAKGVHSGCIIEVGAYRGRSTVFLGRGALDGKQRKIYSIDPHEEFVGVLGGVFGPKDRAAFYRAMLATGCSEIVALINLSSEMFSAFWKHPVSLLWIDGDHSEQGVRRDFECWLPSLVDDSVIAFDDATDPILGPRKLINELVSTGRFQEVLVVGKVAVIRKCTVPAVNN